MSDDYLKTAENAKSKIKEAREAGNWTVDSKKLLEEASKIINPDWQKSDYFVEGVNEASWKGFLYGTRPVPANIYKVYAQVLDLKWEDIVENYSDITTKTGKNNPSILSNQLTIPDNLPSINTWVNGSRLGEIEQLKSEILNPDIRAITITSVCVVGLAGIGKTTLATKLIYELQLEQTPFTHIIWESLQTPTGKHPRFDNIIDSILEKLSNGEITPVVTLLDDYFQKTGRLVNLLKKNTCLLVLDNVETILKTKQANQAGFFADDCPNYTWLFQKLAETEHQGKVIFTSRENLVQLNQKSHFTFKLGGLDNESAIKLLKAFELNATEEELELLVKRYEGHPKALEIVAALIRDDIEFRGVVSKFLENTDWLLVNTLDALLEQIINRMSSEEIVCLSNISVYETSEYTLSSEGIYAQIPKQNKKYIKENVIEALKRRHLLDFNVEKNSYQMHPLIQEKASDLLDTKSFIQAHLQAYNYFISIAKPESERHEFNDIKSFLRAFYHACQAQDYDKAAKAMLEVYPQLRQWSYFDLIENNLIELVPKQLKNQDRLIKDQYIYNDILCCLGVNYEALGKRKLALEFLEKSLSVSLDIGDKQRQAKALSYLGLIHETMGDSQKAIEYFEQTLAIIPSQVEDYQTEYRALSQTGIAYLALGQYNLAIQFFEQSLNVAKQNNFTRGESVALGNLGNTYASLEKPELAIKYSKEFLDFTQNNNNNSKTQIFALIILAQSYNCSGQIYQNLEQFNQATNLLQQALKMSREIQNPIQEAQSLVNLGIAYRGLEEYETAIKCFIAAQTIYEIHNDMRENSNCFYQLALTYIKQEEYQVAVNNLEKSLSILNQTNNYANKKANVLFELAKIKLIINDNYNQIVQDFIEEAEKIAQSLNLPIFDDIQKFKAENEL